MSARRQLILIYWSSLKLDNKI